MSKDARAPLPTFASDRECITSYASDDGNVEGASGPESYIATDVLNVKKLIINVNKRVYYDNNIKRLANVDNCH